MSTPGGPSYTALLGRMVRRARNYGFNEDDVSIMKALMDRGALLNSTILVKAVVREGVSTLKLLLNLGADFRRDGIRALCRAARVDNFDAVSWLLHQDVDINAGIEGAHPFKTIFFPSVIMAAGLTPERAGCVSKEYGFDEDHREWEWSGSASCCMLQYLMARGAKLWASPLDPNPITALRAFLENLYRDHYVLDKVRLILDSETQLKDLSRSELYLLEASLPGLDSFCHDSAPRLDVFELLWERGAPAQPGAALARLIRCKGRRQLVLDLLDSGVDVNAFATTEIHQYDAIQAASLWWDQDLVSALLDRGANINSPALGWSGRTPLQSACTVLTVPEDNRKTQMAFIRFLLHNNADVNAPAADAEFGYTAMQMAAYTGDLELLSLFLSYGAHVNAPSGFERKCALDFAAEKGRLDAVHFLLKAGALSYCRGESGYEGAIRLARRAGYFAIVNSLLDHIENNEYLFGEQPALAAAHRAAMQDRSWTDDMFYKRKIYHLNT
ncbi:ankyrin [Xylariaceae sp. AK1471]|nr:ankyrin [Xylariaceae sp. AK1471]